MRINEARELTWKIMCALRARNIFAEMTSEQLCQKSLGLAISLEYKVDCLKLEIEKNIKAFKKSICQKAQLKRKSIEFELSLAVSGLSILFPIEDNRKNSKKNQLIATLKHDGKLLKIEEVTVAG